MTEISNILDVRPVVPGSECNSFADIAYTDTIRTTEDDCRGFVSTIIFDVFSTEGYCGIQLEAVIHTKRRNGPNTFKPRIYVRVMDNQNNIIHPDITETLFEKYPLHGREHDDPADAEKELYKTLYGLSRNLHKILQHDQ